MTPNATKSITRDHTNTLAALLTAPAPGAIGVIGLRGPAAVSILSRLLRSATHHDAQVTLRDRRPTLCRIVDGEFIVDDAIVVLRFDVGETSAEINTHGGVRVVQRVLALLEIHGANVVTASHFVSAARQVQPLIGRLDEALARAGSRKMAKWLLSQREILPEFLTRLPDVTPEERAAFDRRSAAARRLVNGIHIALVGPPNVGKSTLANRLIGRDRVLMSDTPGTTRDWVSETALVDGWPVTLTDTAGLRETACGIEREAIRRGREQAHSADLILLLIDATMSDSDQAAAIHAVRNDMPADRPVIIVRNKCDSASSRRRRLDGSAGCDISAITGAGVLELERRIGIDLGLSLLEPSLPAAFFPTEAEAAS